MPLVLGRGIGMPAAEPIQVPIGLGRIVSDELTLDVDRLQIVNDVAFVTSRSNDTLYAIDISDPTDLVIIDTLTDSTNLNGALHIVVDGQYAYITCIDTSRVTVVNVSNPSDLSVVSSLNNSQLTTPSAINKVGNYLFVGVLGNSPAVRGLHSLDATTTTLSMVDVITHVTGQFYIEIVGGYAYTLNSSFSSVEVYNISDPTNLTGPVQTISVSSNNMEDAVLVGDNLYTAGRGTASGIFSFDVSTPSAGILLQSLTGTTDFNSAQAIDAIDSTHIALGCAAANKLHIIDVSNPSNMAILDTVTNNTINGARGLKYHNGHIFLASNGSTPRFAAWPVEF